MKATRNIFLGTLPGVVIGWALGFLRLPYIEKNISFLVGFIACLAVISMVIIILLIWNKHLILLKMFVKESQAHNSGTATRTYAAIWILLAAFIFITAISSALLIYRQQQWFKTQWQHQQKTMKEQSELMDDARKSNLAILLNDILYKVDDDLRNNPRGILSEKTIADIITAFNYTFVPYRYWEGDSLSANKLSAEKGQLLVELFKRNIDSVSFHEIILKANFTGADLCGRDLRGVKLSNADLREADFSNADLSEARLSGNDIRNANFKGARLNNINLTGADGRRAYFGWAVLNGAQLRSANLNGADLTNAQLIKADLRKATFRAANLDGVLLMEANMESSSLIDASMQKANLTSANLTKADVNRVNFKEANFTETELSKILNVDKDWFQKLNGWHVTGAQEISEKYKIIEDAVIDGVPRYRLEKI